MALEASVARRYARALFELADEEQVITAITADVERLCAIIDAPDSDLVATLSNPVFTIAERQQALGAVLDKLGFHPLLSSFLRLLMAKNRFA